MVSLLSVSQRTRVRFLVSELKERAALAPPFALEIPHCLVLLYGIKATNHTAGTHWHNHKQQQQLIQFSAVVAHLTEEANKRTSAQWNDLAVGAGTSA